MSAATRAKSARQRASIAIRKLETTKGDLGRSFDDCFEMGDGREVVRIIVEKARKDVVLESILRRRGFGNWLDC